jgi:ABC-2 type transport system ATP-binding protein
MEEAEQLCHQVAIMNRGRIIIQGSVQDLLAAQRDEAIQFRFDRDPPEGLGETLGRLPEVGDLNLSGRCLSATAARTDRAALALLQALTEAGVGVESMSYGGASLEQIFLSITDEGAGR